MPCFGTGYDQSIFEETDPSATLTTTRATDITCGVSRLTAFKDEIFGAIQQPPN
jgi:hypothetical protein